MISIFPFYLSITPTTSTVDDISILSSYPFHSTPFSPTNLESSPSPLPFPQSSLSLLRSLLHQQQMISPSLSISLLPSLLPPLSLLCLDYFKWDINIDHQYSSPSPLHIITCCLLLLIQICV